jgi:hypothetical protein
MRSSYKIFVGKLKVKRLLGRHRCKWKHNITMDIRLKGSTVLIGWKSLRRGSTKEGDFTDYLTNYSTLSLYCRIGYIIGMITSAKTVMFYVMY